MQAAIPFHMLSEDSLSAQRPPREKAMSLVFASDVFPVHSPAKIGKRESVTHMLRGLCPVERLTPEAGGSRAVRLGSCCDSVFMRLQFAYCAGDESTFDSNASYAWTPWADSKHDHGASVVCVSNGHGRGLRVLVSDAWFVISENICDEGCEPKAYSVHPCYPLTCSNVERARQAIDCLVSKLRFQSY
jgi:hypothetical protein